jgi:hypothetical protein
VDLWGEPLAPLRRIQEEINRAFGDQRWAPSAEFPPINIWRGPDGIIVTAVQDAEAKERFPDGWKAPLPYMRVVPQPKV